MKQHLSDYDLALLVHGQDKGKVPREILEHLSGCDACREAFFFIARAELAARGLDAATLASALESAADQEVVARLTEEYRTRWTASVRISPATKLLRLLPLAEALLEDLRSRESDPWTIAQALPLAADSSPEDLPILYLEEPELMIRFRKTAEGELIRAYVMAKEGQLRHRLFLHLPQRQVSILIPEDGVIDLVGMNREDLEGASIGIELDELPETTGK